MPIDKTAIQVRNACHCASCFCNVAVAAASVAGEGSQKTSAPQAEAARALRGAHCRHVGRWPCPCQLAMRWPLAQLQARMTLSSQPAGAEMYVDRPDRRMKRVHLITRVGRRRCMHVVKHACWSYNWIHWPAMVFNFKGSDKCCA